MAQTLKNIVFIGASGNIGKILFNALVESNAFNLTAVSRKTSEATFPANVKVHKSDFSDDDLLSAFKGQDVVISCVGPMAFADQKRYIDVAIKAGVKRFIPSEFSLNMSSKTAVETVPVFPPKAEVLDYLRAKEKDGLTWTGLSVGFLFDWGLQAGIFDIDLASHTASIWDSGNTRFSTTTQATVCKALLSILLHHPTETANQYIHIASFTVTQNEILAALKKASPTPEWTTTDVTTENQYKIGQDMWAKGDMNGMFFLVKTVALGNLAGLKNDFERQEKLWNDVLGLPEESLDEIAKKLVSA